jgi:hypothetical protein
LVTFLPAAKVTLRIQKNACPAANVTLRIHKNACPASPVGLITECVYPLALHIFAIFLSGEVDTVCLPFSSQATVELLNILTIAAAQGRLLSSTDLQVTGDITRFLEAMGHQSYSSSLLLAFKFNERSRQTGLDKGLFLTKWTKMPGQGVRYLPRTCLISVAKRIQTRHKWPPKIIMIKDTYCCENSSP